jgi:hypothetical protein
MATLNPPPNSPPDEVQAASGSRTASFIKQFGGFILIFVLLAALLLFWLASSRITGQVAVATSNQDAAALRGANVTIYSVSEEQQQRITAALAKIQQVNDEEKAANARVFQIQSTDQRIRADLAGYNNLSDTKHCFALEGVMDEIRKSGARKNSTDSQGRFAIRTLPGRHLLEIVGQESNQRFEFIETVYLTWRSNLNLTEPSCRYSLAN